MLDAVLGQPGRRAADRAEVEAAVAAGRPRSPGSDRLPLASMTSEPPAAWNLLHVGVHPAGRGRAERAGGVALRGLGRAGVVDGVVAQVLPASARRRRAARRSWRARCRGPRPAGRSATAGSSPGTCDSSARISAIGRLRSIRTTSSSARCSSVTSGRNRAGSVSSRSRNTPDGGDLAERLAVGRAGDRDRHRAGGAVPGQPDHPHVVAEVPAAELRADAELRGSAPAPRPPARGRGSRAPASSPTVGSASRYLAEAYFAVFSAYSAEVPPMTIARW